MNWIIPGTVLEGRRENAAQSEEQIRSMFLAGGMVLSQISCVTGLEPYAVQNWVKRGFLAPPQRKRYTLRQLCRILNINMLKNIMPMEQICGLLGYINGALDDESDDLIDDSELYFRFLRVAARANDYMVDSPESRDALVKESMVGYVEPVPGAAARVEKVLRIMLTAWGAAQLQSQAAEMYKELEV